MVVILVMSTNFAPPAHSKMISIIVGLYWPTYSSTSIGSLHSLHTVATRRAVSFSLLYGLIISLRTFTASSHFASFPTHALTFSKNTTDASSATHCCGVNSKKVPS